jgi:hypothetical protein
MKAILAAMLTVLLTACASKIVSYTPVPAPADPLAVIEQVLSEQPQKYRPENVRATGTYVEFGDGVIAQQSAWNPNKAKAKQTTVRLYYSSIAENRLRERGRWWIVQSLNKQGSLLATAWTDDRDAALRYIAALDAMRDQVGAAAN